MFKGYTQLQQKSVSFSCFVILKLFLSKSIILKYEPSNHALRNWKHSENVHILWNSFTKIECYFEFFSSNFKLRNKNHDMTMSNINEAC